jgi:hypothetical protein
MTDRMPLALGTAVKADDGVRWIIDAVMLTGGERYYLLSNGPRDVAMWPATMVEPMHDAGGERG